MSVSVYVCVCVYVNAVVSMFAQISSLGRWEGGVRVWVYGGGVGVGWG